MAYVQHTSVATPAVLIDLIASFCSANGWTVERNNLSGALRTLTVRKPGVSDYVHIYNVNQTSISMRVSVGYNAANPPDTQPNVSLECRTNLEAGVYPRLALFANGDSVWAAVSIAMSGEYRHFTFGVLEKIGVYDGGTYCDGSDWGTSNSAWGDWASTNNTPFYPNNNSVTALSARGWLRANVPADGRTNHMYGMGGTSSGTTPSATRSSVGKTFGAVSGMQEGMMVGEGDDNTFSGRSIFQVIRLFLSRTGATTYWSPVGVVSGVRWCNINKFEAEQEVPIAGDVWVVFPAIAKRAMFSGSMSGRPAAASGDYGFALLKSP